MRLPLLLSLLLATIVAYPQVKSVKLPQHEPADLPVIAQLDTIIHPETSGIIKSQLYEGVYWVHNDSGHETAIIPVDRKGNVAQSYRYQTSTGQLIGDAVSMDWEDILRDDQGNVIVADFGNNCNCRRDLVFYYIRESDPTQRNNRVFKRVFFEYPDQQTYPASKEDFNFDAEGAFYAHGKIYVLSKNRSNTYTKLYRLDATHPFEVNKLTLLDTFDIRGKVTGADATEDGKKIAILTYTGVWIFEARNKDDYFDGKTWWKPLNAAGMEAICFDGDHLLISREPTGTLHEIRQDELISIR
ncbi:MAG: hypothetical protein AAF551_11165 [Bacteroidota bacterium]